MLEQSPTMGATAVLGSVDLGGLGDQLLGRVVERELLARLPGWRIGHFAPLGWDRATPSDSGLVAQPLARPERTTIARILQAAQSSVLCPAFPLGITDAGLEERYGSRHATWAGQYFSGGLGAQAEDGHPVLMFGVRVTEKPPPSLVAAASRRPLVAVRDAVSRDRLRAAGVEREILVVPHPALALANVIDFAGLPARADRLRKLGVLPDEPYVLLDVAEPLPVPADSGAERAVTLADDLVVEDRIAAIAAAKVVIAGDEHCAAVAAGLGVPWVLLDPDGTDTPVVIEFGDAQQIVNTPDGIADAVRLALKLPARTENPLLAESFDQLAELVEQHTGTPQRRNVVLSQENEALRRANERLRQRLTVERDKLVEPLAGLWRENADLTGQLAAERAAGAELSRRNEELAAQLADREHQLLAWQNTKLVRWTTPIRRAYGKARGLQR